MRSHIRNQKGQTQGVFFLIGQSDPNDQRTKILEAEVEKFEDFIIGDYIDAYRNVTKKTFTGYRSGVGSTSSVKNLRSLWPLVVIEKKMFFLNPC